MNTHARYQPVRDFPGYICCLSEEDAKKQNKTVGGEIIKVPVFNSRQSAIQWIRKQKNPDSWNIEVIDPSQPALTYCIIE